MRTEHLGEVPWGILISTYVFFVVTSDRSVPCVSHRSCVWGQGFHAHCQKGHISVDYDDHGGILRHRV